MNPILIRRSSFLILIGAALLSGGCATIVKGRAQNVTVRTDPPDANCELSKRGKTVGIVNPTPGTVQIGKGATALDVSCKKSGHLDSNAMLTSSMQGLTVGNLILGGIVGLVVDAGSGAAYQYRSEISIRLPPESFMSVESRDAYFNGWRDDLLAKSETTKTEIAGKCPKDQCANLMVAVDAKARDAMADVEASRQRARILASDGTIVQFLTQ